MAETTQSSLQSAKVRSIVRNLSHVWITSSIARDSATNAFTVGKVDKKTEELEIGRGTVEVNVAECNDLLFIYIYLRMSGEICAV